MLPTLYQFWEIFYKYKSDCVICLPRTLQWFSVSLWHKPDSLLWPLWPPPGFAPVTFSTFASSLSLHSPFCSLHTSSKWLGSIQLQDFQMALQPNRTATLTSSTADSYPNGINQNVCFSEKPSPTTRYEFRCCKLWSLCNLGEIFLRKNCESY